MSMAVHFLERRIKVVPAVSNLATLGSAASIWTALSLLWQKIKEVRTATLCTSKTELPLRSLRRWTAFTNNIRPILHDGSLTSVPEGSLTHPKYLFHKHLFQFCAKHVTNRIPILAATSNIILFKGGHSCTTQVYFPLVSMIYVLASI